MSPTIGYQPGTTILGRYELQSMIGQGGMAVVWRARHIALGRPVAIKLIQAVGHDARMLEERFLREARSAARVRHRNIVDVIDYGTDEQGAPFLVMELLKGKSVADRMTNGPPLDVPELVRIFAQVLSGLAAVHDAGILHRDLKPENVILVDDADGTSVKLVDFGVARTLAHGEGRITQEDVLTGTPYYMSPEQVRGLPDVDHRADLYAVGVMLYEALSGNLPFYSENVGDVLIAVSLCEPAPLVDVRPDLAGAFCDFVARAMAREPEARFKDARAMRFALLAAASQLADAHARRTRTPASGTQRGARLEHARLMEAVHAEELAALVEANALRARAERSTPPSTVHSHPPIELEVEVPKWSLVPWALGAAAAIALVVAGMIAADLVEPAPSPRRSAAAHAPRVVAQPRAPAAPLREPPPVVTPPIVEAPVVAVEPPTVVAEPPPPSPAARRSARRSHRRRQPAAEAPAASATEQPSEFTRDPGF